MEEQFFILKPGKVTTHSFKLYPTTDQAAKYECSAILKDSDFSEIDRANCQFTTTATVLDNGTQIAPDFGSTKNGINNFFESIEGLWNTMWRGLTDFFTGRTCRSKCSGFFDFSCHIQYVCLSWIAMVVLLLAIFPAVVVLLWLLHQKGFFDPLYDWWEDRFGGRIERSRIHLEHGKDTEQPRIHHHHKEDYYNIPHYHHHNQVGRHYRHDTEAKRRGNHRARHPELASNQHHHKHRHHHHHHSHMDSHGHEYGGNPFDEKFGHHVHRMERLTVKGLPKITKYHGENQDKHKKNEYGQKHELHSKIHSKNTQRD